MSAPLAQQRSSKPVAQRDRNSSKRTKTTNGTKTKRAAIYARYSVERDGKLSDAKQVAECKARAAAKGFDVVGIFVDKGISAGEGKRRPQWEALRDLIDSNRVDVVIVSKLDRFTRSTTDFAAVWSEMQQHDVELISISEDFDTTLPLGRAMQQIVITFAELERAFTVERNTGIAKYRRDAECVGGLAPYGYRKAKGVHTNAAGDVVDGFVIEPDEADVVRNVVLRIIEGDSLRGIAASLNAASTPLSQNARKGTTSWSYTTVRQIVTAPAVAGWRNDPALPDEYVRAPWEAIVSDDVWRKMLDALRTSPRRQHSTTNGRDGHVPAVNLLSGLLLCGRCGTKMGPYRQANGTLRYRCSRATNPKACLGLSVNAADAEQHVVDELFASFRKGGTRTLSPVTMRDDDRAAEIEQELDDLLALYEVERKLSAREYVRMRAAAEGELAQLDAASGERRNSTLVKVLEGGDIEQQWNAVDSDGEPMMTMETKRAMLREAFVITCLDNGRKGLRVPIAARIDIAPADERAAV